MAASVADLPCLCRGTEERGRAWGKDARPFPSLPSPLPSNRRKYSHLTSKKFYRYEYIYHLLRTSAQQFLDYQSLSLVSL